LTFTSSEVGNGSGLDSDGMLNQDGGLAVRLQAETGADLLAGPTSRFGDESVTFVSTTEGLTFDIRDLVTGAARGDQFEVVRLGTMGNDTLTALEAARPHYINAGMGNDTVIGGTKADFLVGGGNDDILIGRGGNDSFISGGGNDNLTGGGGMDSFIFAAPLDAAANVDGISDFSHADDTIRFDDAVFAGLLPGPLNPEAFALTTQPSEADDRIIYNQTTGNLFFDEDGGTRANAVLFATLENSPNNIASTDFLVI
jgi:Ca2+-binding RTX toxin-like protein